MAALFLRSFDIASNTITSDVASVAEVIKKGLSTLLALIGSAVKFPAMPVHQ